MTRVGRAAFSKCGHELLCFVRHSVTQSLAKEKQASESPRGEIGLAPDNAGGCRRLKYVAALISAP
jgi:hypothetical protein